MKILYIKQTDLKDCGVSCLLSIVRFYGGYVTREYLRDITKTTSSGVSVYSLVEAGEKLGFETKALKGQITKFKETDFPMIALVLKFSFSVYIRYRHLLLYFSSLQNLIYENHYLDP